jgi:hypothetical protein
MFWQFGWMYFWCRVTGLVWLNAEVIQKKISVDYMGQFDVTWSISAMEGGKWGEDCPNQLRLNFMLLLIAKLQSKVMRNCDLVDRYQGWPLRSWQCVPPKCWQPSVTRLHDIITRTQCGNLLPWKPQVLDVYFLWNPLEIHSAWTKTKITFSLHSHNVFSM